MLSFCYFRLFLRDSVQRFTDRDAANLFCPVSVVNIKKGRGEMEPSRSEARNRSLHVMERMSEAPGREPEKTGIVPA
jgi:hypothetical protein